MKSLIEDIIRYITSFESNKCKWRISYLADVPGSVCVLVVQNPSSYPDIDSSYPIYHMGDVYTASFSTYADELYVAILPDQDYTSTFVENFIKTMGEELIA